MFNAIFIKGILNSHLKRPLLLNLLIQPGGRKKENWAKEFVDI